MNDASGLAPRKFTSKFFEAVGTPTPTQPIRQKKTQDQDTNKTNQKRTLPSSPICYN